jgi:hypothetical protein
MNRPPHSADVYNALTRSHVRLCALETEARREGRLEDVEALSLADALVLMARDGVKCDGHLSTIRLLDVPEPTK